MDDKLWLQMMISAQALYETIPLTYSADEDILKRLIHLGLKDDDDKPWDGAVRSMHHLATIGEHLWSMFRHERSRVSL